MVDDKDEHLSGLYRQSSREEPPDRVDRAVMELARRSVRRRSLAPFGNHRVAVGALAGICLVSVLLVVLLPGTGVLELPPTWQDTDALEGESPENERYQESTLDEAAGRTRGGVESGLEEGDTARPRFDFYSVMPEAQPEVPTGERIVPATAAPASPPMQAGRTAVHVLQIKGFSNLAQAKAMLDKLEFMRLDASIQQVEGTQNCRIRIGPYTDLKELDRVQALLGRRGIRTTRERVP